MKLHRIIALEHAFLDTHQVVTQTLVLDLQFRTLDASSPTNNVYNTVEI